MGCKPIWRLCAAVVGLLVINNARSQAQEPTTRQAVIEQAQAEKSQTLQPYVPSAAERWMAKAQEVLTATEHNWHPYFESAYPAGGFPFGSGFARHVSPYNKIDVRGSYTITRQTEGTRLRRTLGECGRWCRDNRHRAPQEQYVLRCAKRRGYSQYYGVRCHSPCLDLVPYAAMRAWRYWRNRRGGRKMTGRACGRMMAAYPLPRPKIVQGWVECRGGPRARRAKGRRCAGVRTETDDAGCLR